MGAQYVNIFEYADFRRFIEDYHSRRMAEDRTFTRSRFCREMGLAKSRAFINDIIKGKPVSKNYVERFIRFFRFDEDESQYFRALVQFNQSLHDRERELLFDQLISLNRTPKKFVDRNSYAYYKKWYNSAIFALLDVYDFRDDYRELARKLYPPITPKQARESIQLLGKLGMIKRNGNGAWKVTDRVITAGDYVKDELVKQYQLQCLELAKSAILSNKSRPQNITTLTVSASPNIQKKIVHKLRRFKSEVRSMVHKDTEPAENVYQLNIQFFPQSQ